MSVLSRNELRVVLCPDHAALLAIEHRLTCRGRCHALRGQQIVAAPAAGSGETAKRRYDNVLQALETALPAYAEKTAAANLVISNHFSRYMLLPWNYELAGRQEWQSYAEYRFRELYGDLAKQWELRLSRDGEGLPLLSCAVDRRFLAAVREIFKRHGVSIASIQPHLMAAYNGAYPQLRGRSGWFALVEPRILFLALLRRGHWVRLRSLRIGPHWPDDLPQLLEREHCLAGSEAGERDVVLAVPDAAAETSLPQSGDWRFSLLNKSLTPGTLPGAEWGFALEGEA